MQRPRVDQDMFSESGTQVAGGIVFQALQEFRATARTPALVAVVPPVLEVMAATPVAMAQVEEVLIPMPTLTGQAGVELVVLSLSANTDKRDHKT